MLNSPSSPATRPTTSALPRNGWWFSPSSPNESSLGRRDQIVRAALDQCFYNERVNTPDVIIAGAGIIGVSIALELRERGARVLVLDRGEPGQEASSAAAGMLAPSDPETPAGLRPLAVASAQLYPAYVERLESLSQTQVDFRRRGTIALLEGSILDAQELPAEYRRLAPAEILNLEPALQAGDRQTFFVQDDSIDPALLMQAALRAASNAGIEVRGHSDVQMMRARSSSNDVEIETN